MLIQSQYELVKRVNIKKYLRFLVIYTQFLSRLLLVSLSRLLFRPLPSTLTRFLLCGLFFLSLSLNQKLFAQDYSINSTQKILTWLDLQAKALKHSPKYARQQAQIKEDQALAKALDKWENPKVSYRFSPRAVETKNGSLDHSISLGQKLPWSDALDLEQRRVYLKVEQSRSLLAANKLEIIAGLEQSLWSLWLSRQARSLYQEQVKISLALVNYLDGLSESQQSNLSAYKKAQYQHQQRVELVQKTYAKEALFSRQVARYLGDNLEKPTFQSKLPNDLYNQTANLCQSHSKMDFWLKTSLTSNNLAQNSLYQTPKLQGMALKLKDIAQAKELLSIKQRPQFELAIQWSIISQDTGPELGSLKTLEDDALTLQVSSTIPLWQQADQSALQQLSHRHTKQNLALQHEQELWQLNLEELQVQLLEFVRQYQVIQEKFIPLATDVLELKNHEYESNLIKLNEVYEAQLELIQLRLNSLKIFQACALSLAQFKTLTPQVKP